MLKAKRLPMGTMVMILILALATIGVGYGLWSKTLYIMGTINTGSIAAIMSRMEVDQLYDFDAICPAGGGYSIGQDCDGDGDLDDDWEWEGKDVAECEAYLDEVDPSILHVEITDAYPSFNCFVRWDVHNEGRIPLHVYGPAYFIGDTFYGNAINTAELHVNGWPPDCYAFGYDDYVQLEYRETGYCNLHVHLNQDAEQGATYTFNVRIWARQWNEMVPPPW
jgi:hypothetical protein